MRNVNMANVVVRKFMFANKRKVIGILLSLSIGGCIFLCTTYMVENLKVHAELSLISDDGLGSEYRISLKSDSLKDTIPEAVADKIKNMPETENVYATKYTMGNYRFPKTNFCQKKNGVTISNIKIRSRIISRDMMGSVSSRKMEIIGLNIMCTVTMKR